MNIDKWITKLEQIPQGEEGYVNISAATLLEILRDVRKDLEALHEG